MEEKLGAVGAPSVPGGKEVGEEGRGPVGVGCYYRGVNCTAPGGRAESGFVSARTPTCCVALGK